MRSLIWTELDRVRSDRGILALVLVHAGLLAVAAGLGIADARAQWLRFAAAKSAEQARVTEMLGQIERIEAGEDEEPPSWLDPRDPWVLGRSGRPALVPPPPGLWIARGLSDLQQRDPVVTIGSAVSARWVADPADPGRLSLGRFDVAFVLVFLLPLLLVASGDLVATDRSRGMLAALAAHGVSASRLAAARAFARGIAFFLATAAVLAIAEVVAGWLVAGSTDPRIPVATVALVAPYIAIWLAGWVALDAWARSPSWHAIAAVTAWVSAVVILPALVNAAVQVLAPAPTAAELAVELRDASEQAKKNSERIVADFMESHPELEARPGDWMASVHATTLHVERALAPLVRTHRAAAERQRAIAGMLLSFSPASTTFTALAELAGTGHRRQGRAHDAMDGLQHDLRAFVVPLAMSGSRLGRPELERLPSLRLEEPSPFEDIGRTILGLWLTSAAIAVVAWLAWRKSTVLPPS